MQRIFSLCLVIVFMTGFAAGNRSVSYGNSISVRGLASWYSESDRGVKKTTANMEVFDDSQLTCAIWNVPFGTKLKITNTHTGESIVVRVNDRGPAKRLVRQGRIVDLTKAAFSRLADLDEGLIAVDIQIVSSL
ncbi:MAG: septal ring lytic transglycosylase RlpA family lipoprotein [Candidatus Omnitrophica bacterium]|nr:septal ring lytic transglycosylase RlpA family lipoprotein [Candidatus Omnitrophota bacterium]